MEIERINENTVKFYISYVDIESRGFEREEIWYNRERSEQLFWQMMDEVNSKEDFPIEGPLWIQVHALEKGLEIIVTKAHMPKGEPDDELLDNMMDITLNEKSKNMYEEKYTEDEFDEVVEESDDNSLWMIAKFKDFEDVVQLSHDIHREDAEQLVTKLYHFEDEYYLYLELSLTLFDRQEDIISQVLEYGTESYVTHHILDEYGKTVIENDVFNEMKKHFPIK